MIAVPYSFIPTLPDQPNEATPDRTARYLREISGGKVIFQLGTSSLYLLFAITLAA